MYAHTGWSRRRTLDRATIVWSQYMFTYWAGQGCFPAFDVGAWLDWGNDPKPPQGREWETFPSPDALGEADPMEEEQERICGGAGGGEGRELRGTWAGVSEPPRVGELALGEAHSPLFPLFPAPLF